jgi:hypothetical protein
VAGLSFERRHCCRAWKFKELLLFIFPAIAIVVGALVVVPMRSHTIDGTFGAVVAIAAMLNEGAEKLAPEKHSQKRPLIIGLFLRDQFGNLVAKQLTL